MLRETHGVPEGRAARHRRLAAVESHLWRQPQYRADAVSTAARCISTTASRCRAASRRPCAISARFRRRSISTCRRAMNRCCPICATTRRCARNSSTGCMRCSFSGAALSPFVWNSLDELAVQETGFRVPMLTGLGATETAPFFMSVRPATSRSGHVGLPVSGNDAKLVPNNGKLEVRAKGPNVTPGYWRQPELTAAAFDEEGFYKFGDALKPADPERFQRRLRFRWPHRRGFQARQRHLGQRRSAARAVCRGLRAAGARRRDRRHQPRRGVGAGDSRSRRLPPDQSGAAAGRPRRGGVRSPDPRGLSRTVDQVSGDVDGFVDPDHPRRAARHAAVDRSRRSHRQGLDQPARGAGSSRRPDRATLFAGAAGACDNA